MDGIWIRSQGKGALMFCKAIVIDYENENEIVGYTDSGLGVCAGEYASAKRALEVMDDIQKHIYNGVHQVYQMPKE